ncbi:hypothetical protein J437_LFUL005719 [Ladona fulva]|uniref:Carboxylic ester hydrolase n=1 Tax=Ladona fulva TaxID=123851 RepID=A0A8K0JZV7_LADFU|nr:hypothetical protein J437_LFUL005719 [Ladona fulva]
MLGVAPDGGDPLRHLHGASEDLRERDRVVSKISLFQAADMNVARLIPILLGFLATPLGPAAGEREPPLVEVLLGTVRGSMSKTASGKEVASFRGIPYAEPPVGDLRFRAPVPSNGWEGVWDATQERAPCIQRDYIFDEKGPIFGKEDCLYLNVHVPLEVLENVKMAEMRGEEPQRIPVMVYIHGGGWLGGSGSAFNFGPDLLLEEDVILVTMNYRLSAFGFLSTGDKASPGNYGLKDQRLAMKWVNENIAAFGGDYKRVTIFGQSAGGASVHYHVLSPMSTGLFQNGISHSGTALNPWALARNAPTIARTLASYVNCPNSSSQEMVDCLRMKDAVEIAKHFDRFRKWDMDPILVFGPTIEKEDNDEPPFITAHPYKILKTGKFNPVNWMAGATREDGSFRTASILTDQKKARELNEDYDTVGPITTRLEETAKDPKAVARKIRQFYFGDDDIGVETHHKLTDLYNDRHFLNGLVQSLNIMTTVSNPSFNAYFYVFSHRGKHSLNDLMPVINKTSNSKVDMAILNVIIPNAYDKALFLGVTHCDDLIYLFPMKDFVGAPLTDEDARMSRIMRRLWISFAEKGNPTPQQNSLTPVKWEPVKPNELRFLEIGVSPNGMKMKSLSQEYLKRNKFWESLQLSENENYREQIEKDEL